MVKKVTDLKTRLFMEFFSNHTGAKFVDVDTGEVLEWDPIGEENIGGESVRVDEDKL